MQENALQVAVDVDFLFAFVGHVSGARAYRYVEPTYTCLCMRLPHRRVFSGQTEVTVSHLSYAPPPIHVRRSNACTSNYVPVITISGGIASGVCTKIS